MNFLYFSLFLIGFILIDLIYYKKINTFPISKIMHLVSIIIPTACIIYTKFYNFEFFIFCCLLEILIILAFTDIKHFQIDKNSYWLIILFSALQAIFFTTSPLDFALSPLITYGCFWVFDKLWGIEKLGGADVKIMLILSFYYPATDIFSFVIWSFLICTVLFFVYMIIKKTIKNVQVPMIVGFAISFFIQEAFLVEYIIV